MEILTKNFINIFTPSKNMKFLLLTDFVCIFKLLYTKYVHYSILKSDTLFRVLANFHYVKNIEIWIANTL